LQSASFDSGAHISWPDDEAAPGDDLVRLLSVRVVDEEGNTVETNDVRETVGIEMRYRILREGPGVFAKIRVLDSRGGIAFNALDTESHGNRSSSPGVYESTAWLPANLLAEGTTKVDAAICSLRAPKLHQRAARYEAVSFVVFDPGDGDSAKGLFTGQLTGIVRPLLDWTVNRIE
jgi:lipopolysaccharide transport system ATP-binding protein